MAGNSSNIIMSSSKGFTLLELLVVVGVIVTLSTVALSGYRTGEDKFALQRSAVKLAQDLRRAETMAMTGESAPSTFGGIFPSGGYGFYFANGASSYVLFSDCNNNAEYESSGSAISCTASTGANPFPETMETIPLETGAVISNISPATSFSVTFYPPDPTIKITGADSQSYNQAVITLSLYGKTKTVTINNVGLIDIN